METAAKTAPNPAPPSATSAPKPLPAAVLLQAMLRVPGKVSDLIMSPGSLPVVELSGKLVPVKISGMAPLTSEDTQRIAYELIGDNKQARDALQTLGYQTLAGLRCPAKATVEIIRLIAEATGTVEGMIGGQVLDLEGEHSKPTAASVDAIHRAKTGALIRVSLVAGGVYAGGDAEDVRRLTQFGRRAGLAFQIVDDVLDVTQDSAHLGKTAGKDLTSDKATWPAVFGIEASRAHAEKLIEEAFAVLAPYGDAAEGLKAVARYLVERTN